MSTTILKHSLKTILRIPLALAFVISLQGYAQENSTPDELFAKARKTAFEENNFPEAILLTKEALAKSPGNTELSLFLGRLYAWNGNYTEAREVLNPLLAKNPGDEDIIFANASVEYWSQDSQKALDMVHEGLILHPGSEDLLLLQAKILRDMKRYPEANEVVNKILEINPNLTEARALSQTLAPVAYKNAVGLRYDYVYFDKRFDDPWHLASADYTKVTSLGSATARVNYANRFATDAAQFEIDLYPRFSNIFYAYVNAGISDDKGIFPQYRAGFSLYANLPKAYEAEAGFRLLKFADEDTWIYTLSLGKYYKNFWFNFRIFLTPDNNNVTQAYSLGSRYYFGGSDDYAGLRLGTGISPDNNANNVLYGNTAYRLKSNNVTAEYRTTLNQSNVLYAQIAYENQEYEKGTYNNQISVGIGYIHRF